MKSFHRVLILLPVACWTLAGCGRPSDGPKPSAESASEKAVVKAEGPGDAAASIEASLAKLSPDDRKLAEEQKFCAVQSKNRLGSMGVPVKVTVLEEPVFLCCDGCESKALAHADRTLAKAKELKEKKNEAAEK